MAEQGAKRSRGVFKGLWLSDAEWKRVERRMELAEARTFADYARRALTEGKIVVRRVAFDPAPLRAELSRIGNNINQIARALNTAVMEGQVLDLEMAQLGAFQAEIAAWVEALGEAFDGNLSYWAGRP